MSSLIHSSLPFSLFAFLPLAACGEDACPQGVPLGDEDIPCECNGHTLDSLPGCGDLVCEGDGSAVDSEESSGGADSGGCG